MEVVLASIRECAVLGASQAMVDEARQFVQSLAAMAHVHNVAVAFSPYDGSIGFRWYGLTVSLHTSRRDATRFYYTLDECHVTTAPDEYTGIRRDLAVKYTAAALAVCAAAPVVPAPL